MSSGEGPQTDKGLELLLSEEQIRKLGLVSLEKGRLQGDLTTAPLCLGGGYKEDRARLFTVVHSLYQDYANSSNP